MKVSLLQMDMKFCSPDDNFAHAAEMIKNAAESGADVIVLPETWNTGFFPKEDLESYCDEDGSRVKEVIGGLAKTLSVNIVAGSVANLKGGKVYNTAYVFDRNGDVVAEYDKTHLFTPMGEHNSFSKGDHTATFMLDGVRCGIIICYDLRFPELTRTLTLKGVDVLFVVSQWPAVRVAHLNTLSEARAIENQMFVVLVNSCGTAGDTKYGGNSSVIDPWGVVLKRAGDKEEILSQELDLGIIKNIRETINVFRDRMPSLYDIN